MSSQPLPQIRMKRPDLNGLLEMPVLPEGYELMRADEKDGGAIAELMTTAFEDQVWTAERALNELICNPSCKPTFMIKHEGKAVATATLLFEPENHPGAGTLHWVASDPNHRGKQLGLIVCLAVLYAAKEAGCQYSLLLTDDPRIPAIKTYLKLGYVPDCWHESHEARWRVIFEKIGQK